MLEKEDIPILDEIIEKLITTGKEVKYTQFSKHEYLYGLNKEKSRIKFQRLIDIISYYDCARIYKHGYFNTLYINQNTLNFKEKGGFRTLYDIQLSEKDKQSSKEVIIQKESKMTNWKYYSFWPLIICTVISTLIAIIQINESKTDQKSIEQLEERIVEMELKQSKQKNQTTDSSNHTISIKKASTQKAD